MDRCCCEGDSTHALTLMLTDTRSHTCAHTCTHTRVLTRVTWDAGAPRWRKHAHIANSPKHPHLNVLLLGCLCELFNIGNFMQPVPRTHTPLQSHRHTGLGAQGVSGQKYKSKGAETSDLEVPWNVHPGKTHILTFLTENSKANAFIPYRVRDCSRGRTEMKPLGK